MRKITAIMLAMVVVLITPGCEAKDIRAVNEQVKPAIPYEDRMFVYNNGLEIEYKDFKEADESNIETDWHYPVISGLKDKEVQDRMNNEIQEVLRTMLIRLQEEYPENNGNIGKYERKDVNARITYNCNNVIFVDYDARIGISFKKDDYIPVNDTMGIGYDLNTGNRIGLKDLFRPGADYEKKINAYISQYIIENNYDDYEYEMMTKPFQGIREEQSFSLSFHDLIIIIDEKNDDFAYYGYPNSIYIPLKYLGDDLYIFDRYFDEGRSIYERSTLTKKLFPNKIEFVPAKYLEDGNDKWRISIMRGEFINIPDKAVEKKVNAVIGPILDAEKFRREAEEYVKSNKDANFYGEFSHHVEVLFNAGGYLSISSFDEIHGENEYEQYRRTFNYDFNRNKEMEFMDLFINDIDAEAVIKKRIADDGYTFPAELTEKTIKAAIDSKDFSFSDSHIFLHFSPEGIDMESYREWIWIGYEEFGLENISIFN